MSSGAIGWSKRVVLATAILTTIGLLADTSHAFAAQSSGEAGSAVDAASAFALVWLLSSLRLRKIRGHWRFGFELSPVQCVKAFSTVRLARSRSMIVKECHGFAEEACG
jgi:hypothetical protein